MIDVQVIGSINVDTILSVARLPHPGDTVIAKGAARLPGGKGANQAVAAARIGARAAMAGAVGADADGDWMRGLLSEEGIDIAAVQRVEGHPTGTAMIAVDEAGENQIIVSSGANTVFSMGPPCPARVQLAQLEIPLAAVAAAFADGHGLRILNAAPFVAEAAALFTATDILIVNQHELAAYAGLGSDQTPAAIIAAARRLLVRNDQTVIVTLGADGAVAITRGGEDAVPGVPVTARDTVGAGDCFCGTLAAVLATGASLADAMRTANAAAALCTLSSGAMPAMPAMPAVAALLADLADQG